MRNSNSDSSLSVGSVITIKDYGREKFVIGKVLQGGMGTVLQLIPVREYLPALALKTYLNTSDPELFKREAQVWISLGTHPYIAHAIWYGIFQNKASIIAEWYSYTLNEVAIEKWPPQKIIQLVLNLIEGLKFTIQQVGLVHQDIKPDNILMDDKDSPRISDFGLARFASSVEKPSNYNDSFLTLRKTISFGPFGGSPPYMAPELLFGDSLPSEQTDIFSLGVTIYEILTKTHPFIEPRSNEFTNYNLRSNPMRKILITHGEQITPIIRLIQNALIVDVTKRPSNYDELLKYSGLQTKSQSIKKSVDDIVAKVALFRKQHKYEEAIKAISDASKELPYNPILLNSQAIIYLKLKKKKEAISIFKKAVEILTVHRGNWDGGSYYDPAVNLANQLLSNRRFSEAGTILKNVSKWANNNLLILNHYSEIGWLLLFEGNVDKSCAHIIETYKYKSPDVVSLQWLTLASVLSENSSNWAKIISPHFLSLDSMNSSTALCACLIANALSPKISQELYQKAIKHAEIELTNILQDIGYSIVELKKPIGSKLLERIFSSLDWQLTGGKYCGHP